MAPQFLDDFDELTRHRPHPIVDFDSAKIRLNAPPGLPPVLPLEVSQLQNARCSELTTACNIIFHMILQRAALPAGSHGAASDESWRGHFFGQMRSSSSSLLCHNVSVVKLSDQVDNTTSKVTRPTLPPTRRLLLWQERRF